MIHLFSFETIFSAGYTLLTIIWQGRSVVAMIGLPLLWYQLICMTDTDKIRTGDYITMLFIMVFNAMLSNMGAIFAVVMGLAYGAVILYKKKRLRPVLIMGLYMLPNVIYVIGNKILFSGILYILTPGN